MYSKRKSTNGYDPKLAAHKKNVRMVTLEYEQLKRKRAELLALQARQKDDQKAPAPEEKKPEAKAKEPTKFPSAETTKSHWNKLAAAIVSDKEKGKEKTRKTSVSSEKSEKLPPKLFQLVARLSNSKEMMAKIKPRGAPSELPSDVKQSMQYGKYRRDIAKNYDTYDNIKGCRYLRTRTNERFEETPFNIEDIFNKAPRSRK